jgi:hypothetical protein
VGLDQANQLTPRHQKFHFLEKLAFASSLGNKFKSSCTEGF